MNLKFFRTEEKNKNKVKCIPGENHLQTEQLYKIYTD